MLRWVTANASRLETVFLCWGLALWAAAANDWFVAHAILQISFLALGCVLGAMQLYVWKSTRPDERGKLRLVFAYGLFWVPFLVLCLIWKQAPAVLSERNWLYTTLAVIALSALANAWAVICRSKAEKVA